MSRLIRTRKAFYLFVLTAQFLLLMFAFAPPLNAQADNPLEGYITAVNLPKGFEVNGRTVLLYLNTMIGNIDANGSYTDTFFKKNGTIIPAANVQAIHIGAYVRVEGNAVGIEKIFHAETILTRDDSNQSVKGFGIIDKILEVNGERLYRADGYIVRIASAKAPTLNGDLKSIDDVKVNDWLAFSGHRDATGVINASSAKFLPQREITFKAIKGFEVPNITLELPAASGEPKPDKKAKEEAVNTQLEANQIPKGARVKFGMTHFKIPEDAALQERVIRIGRSLIPEFQKQLPAESPYKFNFRFYAIDASHLHGEIASFDGLILVPMQLIARLKNDDQLAAIIADGISFQLQQQMARLVKENRTFMSATVAGDIINAFVPGVSLAVAIGEIAASSKGDMDWVAQRARISLYLMDDAGYDLHQSPEAWRLAADEKIIGGAGKLEYPIYSGYQLNIINQQFGADSTNKKPEKKADVPAS